MTSINYNKKESTPPMCVSGVKAPEPMTVEPEYEIQIERDSIGRETYIFRHIRTGASVALTDGEWTQLGEMFDIHYKKPVILPSEVLYRFPTSKPSSPHEPVVTDMQDPRYRTAVMVAYGIPAYYPTCEHCKAQMTDQDDYQEWQEHHRSETCQAAKVVEKHTAPPVPRIERDEKGNEYLIEEFQVAQEHQPTCAPIGCPRCGHRADSVAFHNGDGSCKTTQVEEGELSVGDVMAADFAKKNQMMQDAYRRGREHSEDEPDQEAVAALRGWYAQQDACSPPVLRSGHRSVDAFLPEPVWEEKKICPHCKTHMPRYAAGYHWKRKCVKRADCDFCQTVEISNPTGHGIGRCVGYDYYDKKVNLALINRLERIEKDFHDTLVTARSYYEGTLDADNAMEMLKSE